MPVVAVILAFAKHNARPETDPDEEVHPAEVSGGAIEVPREGRSDRQAGGHLVVGERRAGVDLQADRLSVGWHAQVHAGELKP